MLDGVEIVENVFQLLLELLDTTSLEGVVSIISTCYGPVRRGTCASSSFVESGMATPIPSRALDSAISWRSLYSTTIV